MKILKVAVLTGLAAGIFAAPIFAAEIVPAYSYIIGVGDVLEINVLQPETMNATATVAPDGSISFPYIGNIKVKDKGLTVVQKEIQTALSDGYLKYPVVTVSLKESRSQKFFVYGEVVKPGSYPLEDNMTVLRGISLAGGFTKFGASSRVKVLRPKNDGSGYNTVNADVKKITNGDLREDLMIHSGDTIVVSEGLF